MGKILNEADLSRAIASAGIDIVLKKRQKYYFKTVSGSIYVAEDISSRVGSERWSIYKSGKETYKYHIIWFGSHRTRVGVLAALNDALGENPEHIRVLQEKIGDALKNKTCIGQCAFYVNESDYSSAIQWLPYVNDPKEWNKIKNQISYTSNIDEVYDEEPNIKSQGSPPRLWQ